MPDINMSIFEEVKRNQLVTEVDIQTQVALDNYQVQLSDIANPTQSQDNVVIDRYGEFLPHWNESLDFDTWVKMSMELAGKKLLIIHGNAGLSSGSSGSDVFAAYLDRSSTSGWTISGGTVTTSGDYLRFYNPTTSTVFTAQRYDLTLPSIFISEARFKTVSIGSDDQGYIALMDGSTANRKTYPSFPKASNQAQWMSNVLTANVGGAYSEGTEYIFRQIIDESDHSTGVDVHLLDTDRNVLSGDTGIADAYGSPTQTDGVLFGDFASGSRTDTYLKWMIFRKYTATEPTCVADGEQNIAVALKTLGRAG